MNSDIKIYVADLAAYSNGKLHGVWIDATLDPGDIHEEIRQMLAQSPEGFAEEYAIHDYEGFEGYALGEYARVSEVHEIAEFIDEHGAVAGELLNHFGGNLDEARAAMEEHYCGCYESLAQFAQELTEESTQIPQHLQYYIDYERMARDMEMSGDVFTIPTDNRLVFVFWSR